MGWDVSYHPIREQEVLDFYFNVLEQPEKINNVLQEFNLDEVAARKLYPIYEAGYSSTTDDPFNQTHGFFIAVVFGICRKYWYTRGAAFSFLIEKCPDFSSYCKPWKSFIPEQVQGYEISDFITANYCSGCILSHANLIRFRDDVQRNDYLNQVLQEVFSHGRLSVFMKAVEYAIEHEFDLLEATDVVIPYPFDLSKTESKSDFANCDLEGLLLYQEAAREQLSEYQARQRNSQALFSDLKLKVLWTRDTIGLSIDQCSPSTGEYAPLTPYFFWPQTDAWEDLSNNLLEKSWINENQRVEILNEASAIINYWQEEGREQEMVTMERLFPIAIFVSGV
jgi:hypothetical protein